MLRPDPPHADALRRPAVFWSLAALAVALRLLCTRWPGHYDMTSWYIVADLVLDGKNVYASTPRYNYGPAWMGILAVIKWLTGDAAFRLGVCLFLSAVDVAIAATLRYRGYALPAILFLFSPWTIFITGHQQMFDNAAVLIGLLAVVWVEGRPGMNGGEQRLSTLSIRDTLVSAALIGCSLVLKHVLWIFPVWMAFRTRGLTRRAIWLLVPTGMFAASFIPFWEVGKDGIVEHVIRYAGVSNATLFSMLAPRVIDLFAGCGPHPTLSRLFFGGGLILAGALLRRRTLLEWYVAYLLFVVLFSSASSNQFFVIPVLFTVLYRNVWGLLYHLLAIPFYFRHDSVNPQAGPYPGVWGRLDSFAEQYGHHVFLTLLAFAVVHALWRRRVRHAFQFLRQRLREAAHGTT